MRNSLYIAVGTAILTAVIGMALSMVLALSAKRFHSVINFLIEIKWSLTFFALSFLVFIPVKHSVISFTIVFSLLLWDRFWEITISEARRSDRPSPLALVRSVIRNQKKNLVSAALIACAASIVFEITISFIGITLSGRMLSLGTLMSEGRNFMFFKPHLMYIPALATVTLLLLINLLRSTLNTRDISN
jgi:peptide/nickel transport system permease protein